MKMLAACEFSGRVRDAFAARGWDAYSCDLLPSEGWARGDRADLYLNGGRAQHYQCNIFDVLTERHNWDLIIAFPPCTDLSLAGARWWKAKQADGRQEKAASFFMAMVNAPAQHVAVENPHGYMTRRYRPPDQVVEPYYFGDPYRKRTCLWLKNLPLLTADNWAELPVTRVTTGGGSWRTDKAAERARMSAYEDSEGRASRAKVRSRTFPGLARAMADQWGAYLENGEAA